MRKLGLIGGMSWVSTRTYYEHINRIVQARTDRRSSAPLLIESLDFAQLYAVHEDADWEHAAQVLIASAPSCSLTVIIVFSVRSASRVTLPTTSSS